MECLKDYIAIKGCGLPTPASGMYINQLAGIEFQGIEQLANADQQSFVGVWNDVQTRAIERFRVDVIGKLSGFDKRYKLRQITQTVDLGKSFNPTITTQSANQRGLILELHRETDQAVCSNMQSLYIQSVNFYLNADGDYTITITDADFGTVLDSFPFTGATSGWNAINVDKQYDYQRVIISVDATSVDTVTTDISQFNLNQYSTTNPFNPSRWSNGGWWTDFGCAGTANVRGITTDTSYKNPVYGTNTFGVSCIFSVRCTYNNVVCSNKRYFASAFRLLLGIELMDERIFTSRINKWTTVNAKDAKDLQLKFELQYRGGVTETGIEYEGELNQAIQTIDLDLSDCCLECSQEIEWKETQM
jgi:hypothetical protein